MLERLKKASRLLIEAPLVPMQGERFQPTGFADLGAATYQLPDGTPMVLVESAQSVANRLEATILKDDDLDPDLAGLSYVKAKLEGASDASTSSLIEAHRLNSPFIITDSDFQAAFKKDGDYAKGRPLDWKKLARAFFKYDVNSLLHGAFMANLDDGRVKMARAVSGFIEARGVREVVSGGVKNNPIDPTGKIRAAQHDKDVYSNVPYQRVEYTAEKITAYFNLDLGLLRSYALGDDAWDLLVSLAMLKIRRFLDGGLRLRTACDFRLDAPPIVTAPTGYELAEEEDLLGAVKRGIQACGALFADPPVTLITCAVVEKETKKESAGGTEAESDAEESEE